MYIRCFCFVRKRGRLLLNRKYKTRAVAAGNTITVTNHSNTDINAELTYTHAVNYTGISGHFDNSTLSLESVVGTPVNEAPTKSATLTLSGVLDKAANNSTVGTVTVTLGD